MRELLVTGDKVFRLRIPDDAKVTFGPWSPGEKSGYNHERNKGTLRIYVGSKENIIGCFSGVSGFRDTSILGYAEQVAKEEGATIWKDDEQGYMRESKVTSHKEWVEEPEVVSLPSPKKNKGKK